jgi:hypothetical protein
MNKRKIAAYAGMSAFVGASILGMSVASAHGMLGFGSSVFNSDQFAQRQTEMFEKQAQILGITTGELKDAWSSGKTMQDLIKEKNLDSSVIKTRMQQAAADQMKTQLQTLVGKGVITQAQADARLAFMQTKMQNMKGRMGALRSHRF